LIICATIAGILSLVNWWMLDQGQFRVRLTSVTRASYAIQGMMAYSVIFLLVCIRLLDSRNKWLQLAYGVAAIILLAVVALSQSRGVILPLIFTTGVLILLKQRWQPLLWLSVIVVVLVGVSFLWIDWLGLWHGFSRTLLRPDIWLPSWHQALETPWFGHGHAYTFTLYAYGEDIRHPHSIYLATFFYGGVLGLFFLAMLVGTAFYMAWQNRAQPIYLFVFIILVLACTSMFSDLARLITSPREHWLYFWLPLGLLLATSVRKPRVR